MSSLSITSQTAVNNTIALSALRAERAIAWGRLAFLSLILVRYIVIDDRSFVETLATGIPLGIGIVFSLLVLIFLKHPPRRESFWSISVTIDALCGFTALLPNVLTPGFYYINIVSLPDTAGVFVAVICAGLRLSTRAAIWGGLMNVTGLVILVFLDRANPNHAPFSSAVLYIANAAAGGALAVILAMTTRRLARKGAIAAIQSDLLAEQDKTKSKFFANVSHELRTPLTLIVTPLEQLAREHESLPVSLRKKLSSMRNNTHRLLRLVNQLLDFAAVESAKVVPNLQQCDFKVLLEPLIEAFQPFARSKEVYLKLRGLDDSPSIVTDPELLDKVLCNLISNSCKFTQPTGVVVVRLSHNSSEVTIAVRDTGPGIAEGDISTLFERFKTHDHPSAQQGSGIGLALSKELTELLGGTLSVESEVNVGSTFTVRLPLVAGGKKRISDGKRKILSDTRMDRIKQYARGMASSHETKDKITPTFSDDGGSLETKQPLVLVVDDNPDMRALVGEILESSFCVIEAEDGGQALELLNERRPSLVISDVMMPKVDGMELLERIRSLEDSELATTPVMLLTAQVAKNAKLTGLESGSNDFLEKPFDPRELYVRSANLIRLRQQEQTLREMNKNLQDEVFRRVTELEKTRFLRRYLPPSVVQTVLEAGDPSSIGQKRLRLTVFHLELSGFGELTDATEPEDLAAMLNSYISEIKELAFAHGATIARVVRDEVVGFWGAPTSSGDKADAVNCARCGLELWQRSMDICSRWHDMLGRLPLPTVAICTGFSTVGNFGSSRHLDYAAVGGPMEEVSEIVRSRSVDPGSVVCSSTTWMFVNDEVQGDPCGETNLPGRSQPVVLYRLAGPPDDLKSHRTGSADSKILREHNSINQDDGPNFSISGIENGALLSNRYRIHRLLGVGGMGMVYLAHDAKLDIDVALKFVRRDLASKPKEAKSIYKEVKLARLVSHKNVARIYDLIEWADSEFISMEYIEGQTLGQYLKSVGQIPIQEGLDIWTQLCRGLAAAHACGVIHRDIKPSNVMLDRSGRAVILDFGVSRWSTSHTVSDDRPMGTPHYMAPEQIIRKTITPSVDLYSLGVLGFEMFAGRLPFEADNNIALALKHTEESPPNPRDFRADLTSELAAIILRCLKKNPSDRFESVDYLRLMLESNTPSVLASASKETFW